MKFHTIRAAVFKIHKPFKIFGNLFVFVLFVGCVFPLSAQTINYRYDSQNRLKSAVFSNGNSETYYYDRVGNRINQINVTVSNGVQDPSAELNDFKVFPNPSNGLFTIMGETDVARDFKIVVVDENGKIVLDIPSGEKKRFDTTIDLQNLSSGTYILSFGNGRVRREWNIVKL